MVNGGTYLRGLIGHGARESLLGLSADDIQYGRLHPIHRGVYAVRHPPVSGRTNAIAAVLARGAGAALGHSSATLWGITKPWQQPLGVTG